MRKEIITIEKRTFNLEMGEYMVFVYQEEKTLNFYIQKKQYGVISYVLGIEIKDLEGNMDEFIQDNIDEWVTICEHDIAKLER